MIDRVKGLLLAVSAVFAIAEACPAQTWTGAVSTNWGTAGNWSPASVPGTTSAVIVPHCTNQPVISSGLVVVGSLTLEDQVVLTVNGAQLIVTDLLGLDDEAVGDVASIVGTGGLSLQSAEVCVGGSLSVLEIELWTVVSGNGSIVGEGAYSNYGLLDVFNGTLTITCPVKDLAGSYWSVSEYGVMRFENSAGDLDGTFGTAQGGVFQLDETHLVTSGGVEYDTEDVCDAIECTNEGSFTYDKGVCF